MKTSDLIYARLLEEAKQFLVPEKRLATLERLKSACDSIASGERVQVDPGGEFSSRKIGSKINPSNIDRLVRSKKWTGPTRSFIANKSNGLIEYVIAREEERSAQGDLVPKTLPTQLESYLSEIESVEVRQIMRHEIELRRKAEQEIKIIKEALRKIPQIDVRNVFEDHLTTEKMEAATATSQPASSDDAKRQLRNLVDRLTGGDLRRLGLKWDRGDIITLTNAPVVLSAELSALIEIAGLPLSLLKQEEKHGEKL